MKTGAGGMKRCAENLFPDEVLEKTFQNDPENCLEILNTVPEGHGLQPSR